MSLLIWLACAGEYEEREFQADYDDAFCVWQDECTPYAGYEECLAAAEDEPWAVTDCAYDAEEAELCVAGVEEMECMDEYTTEPDFPPACGRVWDCSVTPED
ncbi:MAG: hypothetical protein GY913_14720 [Proteobacteria bacterium]|nr:hypothetical protein [Pseudomonadota bacterium]MCP4918164.1 hypothetical protein [Pseudomonadota bacterium]